MFENLFANNNIVGVRQNFQISVKKIPDEKLMKRLFSIYPRMNFQIGGRDNQILKMRFGLQVPEQSCDTAANVDDAGLFPYTRQYEPNH